jgi:hypothetical protein
MSEIRVSNAGDTQRFEWLRVESMRLMEEHSDAEYGICGSEWFVIEELRDAEEAGRMAEMLRALRECSCAHVAEMASAAAG